MSNAADFTEFDTLIDQMDAAVAESSEYRKSTRDKLKLIHDNIVAINTWVEKYSTGITNSKKQSDDLSALVAQLKQDLETATQKGTEDMKTIEQMAADKTELEAEKARVDAEIAARVERMNRVQEKMKVWLEAIRHQPDDFSPDELTAILGTIDKIVEAANIQPPPPPPPPNNGDGGNRTPVDMPVVPNHFPTVPNQSTKADLGMEDEDDEKLQQEQRKKLSMLGGRRSRRRRKTRTNPRRKTAARGGRKPRSRSRSRTRSRSRSRSRPRTKKRTRHRKRGGSRSKSGSKRRVKK